MTRRVGKTLLVTLLSLLSLATSASAECAWVLWARKSNKSIDVTSPQSASPSKAECETEVVGMSRSMKSNGFEVTTERSNKVIGRRGYEVWSFFCLPDTVDPRGPKGHSAHEKR
jgi:hypothetical protein